MLEPSVNSQAKERQPGLFLVGNRLVSETQHQFVIQIEAANVEAWLFTGGWDGGVSPR
jgi:hypothetical protein